MQQLQKLYKESVGKPHGFYVFCDLFSRVIERDASFDEKVFQVLQDHFQYFISPNSKEGLFIIETPPRTGKSLLTTILGSVYVALSNPKQRGMIVTSNEKTRKFSFHKKIEDLIKTDFFLSITGLKKKDFTINDSAIIFPNGFILQLQTTHSSNPIGSGYHWLWLDDFMQHLDTLSETKTDTAHAILSALLTRKEYNMKTNSIVTKIFTINQRLGFNDISARFIETFTKQEVPFLRLTLPYHFRIHGDTEYKLFNGKTITFQREEYLRSVFSEKSERRDMAEARTEANFYTQYLQIVTQGEETIFDTKHIQYYNSHQEIENITNVFITVDFAFETKKNNDYTACIVWGADLRDVTKPKLYALDIAHHKKNIVDSISVVKAIYHKWVGCKGTNRWHSSFQGVFVEDVTANAGVFPLLSQNAPELPIRKISRASNSKLVRANGILPMFRQDVVYLPRNHPLTERLVSEVRCFTGKPNQQGHDDLVDCAIDGFQYGVMQSGTFEAGLDLVLKHFSKPMKY